MMGELASVLDIALPALPEEVCTHCGACCANFRVSFYWRETDSADGGMVPASLTEGLDDWRVCMKGTRNNPVHCIALEGVVGEFVRCAIYDQRPSPCRHFGLHREEGGWIFNRERLRRCNVARKHWHLAPLLDTLDESRKKSQEDSEGRIGDASGGNRAGSID